jgi:hypothetical protein
MYVEAVPNRNSPPAILLRDAWREGGRIRKRTLANLSKWSPAQIQALQAVLKGNYGSLAPASDLTIERTRPHGPVAAALGTVRQLKLDRVLSLQPCPEHEAMLVAGDRTALQARHRARTARGHLVQHSRRAVGVER